jgi:hypothetical protein
MAELHQQTQKFLDSESFVCSHYCPLAFHVYFNNNGDRLLGSNISYITWYYIMIISKLTSFLFVHLVKLELLYLQLDNLVVLALG